MAEKRITKSSYVRGDTVKFDRDCNRAGEVVWKGDTGTEFDKTGQKLGYLKKRHGDIILYDKNWNRRGFKKKANNG
ncbi:MAG: hypothetical protein JRE47_10180, partial [Deltaproteobacteria bacterium]|nr:hypothetical protein [Deltaproteobacteria bacterium]